MNFLGKMFTKKNMVTVAISAGIGILTGLIEAAGRVAKDTVVMKQETVELTNKVSEEKED